MTENDPNFANQGSTGKSNEEFKSDGPKSTDVERKETRKNYKMLMETTAKFDDIEPFEVPFHLLLLKVDMIN